VVEELLSQPEKLTLGGEERELTILFADLENFTGLSEQLPPQQLVLLLNEYFSEMTQIIIEEGGTIDKYIGDAIMAEFGAPLPVERHADQAVSAALKMQRRLQDLQATWAAKDLPELKCRIGIHTGSVIVGNMGSDRVFDYTVIGDAANLASRLQGANKHYRTYLMISESTSQALTPGRFLTRMLDVIKVKGRETAVTVFEVYGKSSDTIASEDLKYYQLYQEAFVAYLDRNFALALEKFASALQIRPNDPAAKDMISRIVSLSPEELPKNWDGSIKLESK
jgi:adenylate cyclase